MITSHTKILQEDLQPKTIFLRGISKKYPLIRPVSKDVTDFKDFWALKDIFFEVYKGQALGIIGRNGAGKTTLLNIISGVISPTHGEISVNGKVLGLFNLGVGFQDELTGKENIFLNGIILGFTRKEIEDKLEAIIDFSELGEFINMPLGSYSQGMRLRLGFSIIANLDFDVLIIDEVLAVGDVLFQNKCFSRLMDFKRRGKTLLITTQSMDLIEKLCDRVLLLDHGEILFEGSVLEGINRYYALLNTERFFVGPLHRQKESWFENTKKWADNLSDWGKKFGTKDVVIDKVEFINKFGRRCESVKSGDPLRVKVNFVVRNIIKEPHFGVAIFRNDGVYCYGPNTAFDGYEIKEIKEGKGCFELQFKKLLLAPGEYMVSIAVWDKNEILPFDFHNGYYKLIVEDCCNSGNKFPAIPTQSQLLKIPFKIRAISFLQRMNLFKDRYRYIPDLEILRDRWERKIENGGIKIESVKLFNFYKQCCFFSFGEHSREKNILITNKPAELIVTFSGSINYNKSYLLWIGLYRDDGICCQHITQPFSRIRSCRILFPELPLLPGNYRLSIGIWGTSERDFLICHHGVYPFQTVFNQPDHGTVYLKHNWKWRFIEN